jgi:hypothetical protein
MSRAKQAWALALGLIALSACGSSDHLARQFTEPPIGSSSVSAFQVRIDDNAERLDGAIVSRDFFPATKARPLIGRFFDDGEYRAKTRSAVVLNHEFWQRRLHGSPRVIGTILILDDQPATIIGVAEPGFADPTGAQLWLPRTEP